MCEVDIYAGIFICGAIAMVSRPPNKYILSMYADYGTVDVPVRQPMMTQAR